MAGVNLASYWMAVLSGMQNVAYVLCNVWYGIHLLPVAFMLALLAPSRCKNLVSARQTAGVERKCPVKVAAESSPACTPCPGCQGTPVPFIELPPTNVLWCVFTLFRGVIGFWHWFCSGTRVLSARNAVTACQVK